MFENISLELDQDLGDIQIPMIKEGDYRAIIQSCELKESKKGSPMIEVEVSVGLNNLPIDTDITEAQNFKAYFVYSDNVYSKKSLGDFLKAVGLPTKGSLNNTVLLGANNKEVMIKIKHEDYQGEKIARCVKIMKVDTPM
jgi:hypothetical protein